MLLNLRRRDMEERNQFSWPDYLRLLEQFTFNGTQYLAPGGNIDELNALQGGRNPIVAACIAVRGLVFSEVRFVYQQYQSGRPGNMFGTEALSILERPWPSATTGDLLARMEVDASLYGNSYWVRPNGIGELIRLNPTKVIIATADVVNADSGLPYGRRLIGYSVVDDNNNELAFFEPNEVCHYKPLADPSHPFRGQAWLSTVLPDVGADNEMTTYKHAFLKNSATPNMVVKFDPGVSQEALKKFQERLESRHQGARQAFNTLYLGAGADIKMVGSTLDQLSFKNVQGAGETRIAAAAGVPASILGISEGLAGSALNAGNYTAARRRFADGTMRPLWRSAAGALQNLVGVPSGGVRLWYDDRDVSFLQEDVLDAADIRGKDASTMRTLVDGGFDPDSVIQAVTTGDMTLLTHTGTLSVQLQPPSDGTTPTEAEQ
jgi:HK97 family phage portal protein